MLKQLQAEVRTRVGKGAARAVRRQKQLPAVIYGGGQAPLSISLDANRTNQLVYAGHFLTTLFEIEVDGRKERVIPRDYQLDPVKDFVVHVDFLRVSEDTKIKVDVPIHVVGQESCAAIKSGCSLEIVGHSVELLCPVNAIPDHINVDVSKAVAGSAVHLSDVVLPEGVKSAQDARSVTLVSLSAHGSGEASAEGSEG